VVDEPIDKSIRPSAPASEDPPELAKLPPGRHGLSREFVLYNQRERLIAGLAESIAEHGYAGTTVAHITRAAAVSRRTFYEHFSSKEDCFAVAYETVMEDLRKRVSDAFDGVDDWPRAIRASRAPSMTESPIAYRPAGMPASARGAGTASVATASVAATSVPRTARKRREGRMGAHGRRPNIEGAGYRAAPFTRLTLVRRP